MTQGGSVACRCQLYRFFGYPLDVTSNCPSSSHVLAQQLVHRRSTSYLREALHRPLRSWATTWCVQILRLM
jgi:hypothetical protein